MIMAALAATGFAHQAQAQGYVVINGLSYHADRSLDRNELNYGAGIGMTGDPCGGEIGVYHNSYSDTAFYAVGVCETRGPHHFGVFLGAANGYADDQAVSSITFIASSSPAKAAS